MVVLESNCFGIELIKVRSLEDRITMARKIAVALVIRDDNDDVGLGVGICLDAPAL